MQTVLIWFAGYLCTGVVGLLLARFAVVVFRGQPWSWSELKQDISGDVATMLPVAVIVWPLLPFIPLVSWSFSKVDAIFHGNNPHHFHCQRAHLIRPVSVSEAEAGAVVVDPLGRAPALPFGHLNAGWNMFLKDRQPGWNLWRFEVPGYMSTSDKSSSPLWCAPRGRKVGYVWANRWKHIELEFICESD